jgi:hypothetical protein
VIIVRFRSHPGAKIERVEIDESKHDPFDVLQACIDRIDRLAANQSPPGQVPVTARPGAVAEADSPPAADGVLESATSAHVTPARAGVRDASMIAYRALEWSGRMTKQQRLVMDFFAINPQRDYTRQELASGLNLGVNVICGRVNELMKPPFSLLQEVGRRRCRITGESANALRAARLMQAAA